MNVNLTNVCKGYFTSLIDHLLHDAVYIYPLSICCIHNWDKYITNLIK
jgi:hypothetical protein